MVCTKEAEECSEAPDARCIVLGNRSFEVSPLATSLSVLARSLLKYNKF